ncbi:MAG: hypothetical protein ABL974_04135, partial [Prosthecobacter sp.]
DAMVVGHEMTVDRKRWDEREQEAVRVDTRLELEPRGRRELVAARFFKDSAAAWKFMLANPSGKTVSCLVSPAGDVVAWDQFWSSPQVWAMLIGSMLLILGLWQLVRWPKVRVRDDAKPVLFCSIFLLAGILGASLMWPALVTRVRAAGWDMVPCKSVERRSVSSGKSSTTQFSFRYTYQGKDYLAVKTINAFDESRCGTAPSLCRVNPEVPWRVELSWGWRPGLGVALFPFPFLAVGIFALIIPFSPRVQRMIGEARKDQTGNRFHLPADRMTDIGGWLFAFVFAGSIVGVFVSVCAEMWIANHDHKWFLTIFLIPFVLAVLFLAKGLVVKLWESWRG